ncbi:WD40/YVTN/BNR-like repeat-containing protein [Ferruginibacter sp. SUN106]|uniref:WD40/YVTN/BNR-like repeat-containing protein n=1 Tax=Ferruginibacter sp. SUN106 TaxID=2978348 RepID=UPI003D364BFD
MKRIYQLLVLLCVLQACKKNNTSEQPVPEKIKIQVISGNNQSDTIGHLLKDSLLIKVTIGSRALARTLVNFNKEDCPSGILATYLTDNNGFIKYPWQLTGKTGDQPIKLTAIDSLGLPADSLIVHAEGRSFLNAWQPVYCLPHAGVNDLCQAGSGRMFLGLLSFDYPYYSDDNGINWQRLTSFPVSNLEIRQMVANGNDVYIATRHNGVYYSSNNGASWENRSSGITDTRELYKLGITKSGKLFFSNFYNRLYMSVNKGLAWTELTSTAIFNEHFDSFCETSTGVLYMTSAGEDLFKSTNGGTTWTAIHPNVSYSVQSIFVDDNDDLYIGAYWNSADIYKSTNGGTSWTLKYSSPQVPGTYLEVKPFYKVNGKYYFMVAGYGIVTTSDFITYRLLTNRYSFEYLIAANNAVLVPGSFENLWYNQNP